MKAIALVCIILIATAIVAGTVPAAEPTPIIPGMGNAPVEDLTNIHPTVKGNAAIMNYIGECGVGQWHEERMNADFKSVHLTPANSCGKQLVFSIRDGGRDDPTRITDIWIIGADETWSSSMDTVNPGGGSSRVRLQTEEEQKAQDSLVMGAVVILAILGIAFALIERRKRSS